MSDDTFRSLGLVAVSLILFPVSLSYSILAFSFSHFLRRFFPSYHGSSSQQQIVVLPEEQRKTILVTGVGMAKGLTLARAFYLSGHRVIGADFENDNIPCPGRFSCSLSAFYPFKSNSQSKEEEGEEEKNNRYTNHLLSIIRREKCDLWVSCSGVATAAADALAKDRIDSSSETCCQCIQSDLPTTMQLHEKDGFSRVCSDLSLPFPKTFQIRSFEELLSTLDTLGGEKKKKKDRYILKPVGISDAHRGSTTLLPLAGGKEATRAYVSGLFNNNNPDYYPDGPYHGGEKTKKSNGTTTTTTTTISPSQPWILQRYVRGGKEYCTHALVVRDEVRCFVACRSSDMLMRYRGLSDDDGDESDVMLEQSFLRFTREYLSRRRTISERNGEEEEVGEFTGHLSFDFMVEDDDDDDNDEQPQGEDAGEQEGALFRMKKRIFAIECNPRAHTAVVLFGGGGQQKDGGDDGVSRRMVEAYLDALGPGTYKEALVDEHKGREVVTPPENNLPRYWIGHDLVEYVLQPLFEREEGKEVGRGLLRFLEHVIYWKEGTYEVWDPLPALALYHVYWPLKLLRSLWVGEKWSRVNVSTTKMFMR